MLFMILCNILDMEMWQPPSLITELPFGDTVVALAQHRHKNQRQKVGYRAYDSNTHSRHM